MNHTSPSGAAPPTGVRNRLKRLLSTRTLGVPAAITLDRLGLRAGSRRVGRLCRYCPAEVRFTVPGGQRVRMLSAGGRDQFAVQAWYAGWTSIEASLPAVFAALSRDAAVLDIGANTGVYALIAAASGAAQVHAFEPLPAARQWLERNIALNDHLNGIRVIPEAVSASPGKATLYIPVPRWAAVETSASLEAEFRPDHAQAIEVPVRTIDAYVDAEAIQGPLLLKVDVEGHEPAVLRGARATLRSKGPILVVEVLTDAAAAGIRAELDGLDYQVYRLGGGGIAPAATIAADPGSPNQLFCPARRGAEMMQRLAAAGVPVRPA
jgi:FkbM family methyltransferase